MKFPRLSSSAALRMFSLPGIALDSGCSQYDGRYVMYGDIYCTEIYISYIYTFLTIDAPLT